MDESRAAVDPFDGLRRIGIDEISYKRGHRYLTVVVDHDTGRLVWAGKGHDKKTLRGFFDLLGDQCCARIRLVSCDAAEWIGEVVAARCRNAAFHLVKWVTEALDEVRRETWNEARRAGMKAHARDLKHARYALWKNPEDLTARQEAKLGRRIRKNLPGIQAALRHKLSNALIESTNTKIRVLTRMAFGFKKPDHLIALALLDRGGYCPALPARQR